MAGIYIHIPYCRQACHYCDFHFSVNQKNRIDLIDSIRREIQLRSNFFESCSREKTLIETIYFGGGTPSVLHIEELSKILFDINQKFLVSPKAEVTIECNPDDLQIEYCNDLFQTGFNRLSIGVQSFSDSFLQVLNRSHTGKTALLSIDNAIQSGFKNISIDLMYGLPDQSLEDWKKELDQASQLEIKHLSCYNLTIEENTVFGNWTKHNKLKSLDEQISAYQFEYLMQWADVNEFEQYEISNFAKSNYRSLHNSSYWLYKPYLGIGPSAHSFDYTYRYKNGSSNAKYIKNIQDLIVESDKELLSNQDKLNDYVLTSLRTSWGINLEFIKKEFGLDEFDRIGKISRQLKTEYFNTLDSKSIALSNKGRLWADYIAEKLFKSNEC